MTTGRGGFASPARHVAADDDPTIEAKRAARAAAMARRAEAHAAHGRWAPTALRDIILSSIGIWPGAIVSGFAPIGEEIDTRPTLEAFSAAGHAVCLPVVLKRGQPLIFRRWVPGEPLHPGTFGVPIPPAGEPELVPDVLLVPLLAFDRQGDRLGYGAGFYDMTIHELRGRGPRIAIGVGYAAQELPRVPTGPNDSRLDWIATEERAFRVPRVPRPDAREKG